MNNAVTEAKPVISHRAVNIRKSFMMGRNEIKVLSGANGEFAQGEVTMIRGASGSGKSTLLQVLGGLDVPDAGEAIWHGESIYKWPKAQLAKWRNRNVGFIFQSYHLLPELSALENVELPARLGRDGGEEKSLALLQRVGLAHRANHRPAELSGGEQQRVAIARALRNDPDLLLADEPTGNLDSANARDIMRLLLELQGERKKTLIVVTHDDTLASLGQNLYYLENGILERKEV